MTLREMEIRALRNPTARNKRAVRDARRKMDPLSPRRSRIWFLSQAQKPWEDAHLSLSMDDSFFFNSPGKVRLFEGHAEKARRLADEGVRVRRMAEW